MRPKTLVLAALAGSLFTATAADVDVSKIPPASKKKIDFVQDIYPIFDEACISCHGPEKQKGKYRMDTKEGTFKKGDDGPFIIPGDSAKSPIVHMIAGLIDEMLMPPPDAEPLTPEQIGLIRAWIDQGAHWPDGPIAKVDKKIDFATQIKPIFQRACYECHGPNKQEGSFRIDTKEAALKGGEVYGNTIKAADPAKSSFLIIVAGKDPDLPHPEKHKLPEKEIALITKWIEQGANW
ncbi:MAG TPA: c-type cytochrome domain-containing protein [Methylomirabilota bacterium]|nr:c-type cytochrome domain-containing protein [Methylomirabilota bacterium]